MIWKPKINVWVRVGVILLMLLLYWGYLTYSNATGQRGPVYTFICEEQMGK